MISVPVERGLPGDIVLGRETSRGEWILFEDDERFKIKSNVMSLSSEMQRLNGKTTLQGLDTWILVHFKSLIIIEDRSK